MLLSNSSKLLELQLLRVPKTNCKRNANIMTVSSNLNLHALVISVASYTMYIMHAEHKSLKVKMEIYVKYHTM